MGRPAVERGPADMPTSSSTAGRLPSNARVVDSAAELAEPLHDDFSDLPSESVIMDGFTSVPAAPVEEPMITDQMTASAPATPAPAAKATGGAPKRSAAESPVRVGTELLDDLMRLVGELVLTRNQIVQQTSAAAKTTDMGILAATQRLDLIASELQEGVTKTRMQPIDALWNFPRVVRAPGAQRDEHVRLEMVGKETELDRTLLEAVKDFLTHLVLNSVDHGVEPPDVRLRTALAAIHGAAPCRSPSAGCFGDAAVDGHVSQVQVDHAVVGVQGGRAQLAGQPGARPLVPASAHRGGRAGRIGDALVARAVDQGLDQVVEDQSVVDAGAVLPRKREVPPAQRVGVDPRELSKVDQGQELLTDRVQER